MYDEEYATHRFGKASKMAPLVLPQVSKVLCHSEVSLGPCALVDGGPWSVVYGV
jgi:hypothetical protein